MMLTFNSPKVVSIGEAMVEMAVVGDNQYRRDFAGDTYNTAWHIAQVLGDKSEVSFVTCVGTDTMSDRFLEQIKEDGLDTSAIRRVADRNMGLYLIELDGVERSFHYWRNASSAKLLADDQDWLDAVIKGAGLIHISGITLAILSPVARARLLNALTKARHNGARVSFDPNIRPKLWASTQEMHQTVSDFLKVTDIALPSFDDEQNLWGDGSPAMTISRIAAAGVTEIVIKNGEDPVSVLSAGQNFTIETPAIAGIRDTTGAGDAFNAGYLAARLRGQAPEDAVAWGQKSSGEVICHFGARIPKGHDPKLPI
ncbi:2-dehydro-3-deoxygluconokinase [Sulfitobacter sp. SK012]|uniref:sugar kinase n=1 Tax=Sulfitobacter sp. SK012 TaxID=1389005 RepID=UPI000E0C83E3|nr:sugar kinase [Sulfitobacter sp. SK012]AXI48571.1 2-dehydro-3-deoxygluconokinase [Sulfitobacter sp. SK012]